MIFITSNDEKPLFTAFVNGISEKEQNNGGTITNYILGTSEIKNKGKENESREYSSWFATLMGEAKRKNDNAPLKKGDRILIKSFKITNVSKKMDDGTYGKAYFNMKISDYELAQSNNNAPTFSSDSLETSDDDSLPF